MLRDDSFDDRKTGACAAAIGISGMQPFENLENRQRIFGFCYGCYSFLMKGRSSRVFLFVFLLFNRIVCMRLAKGCTLDNVAFAATFSLLVLRTIAGGEMLATFLHHLYYGVSLVRLAEI